MAKKHIADRPAVDDLVRHLFHRDEDDVLADELMPHLDKFPALVAKLAAEVAIHIPSMHGHDITYEDILRWREVCRAFDVHGAKNWHEARKNAVKTVPPGAKCGIDMIKVSYDKVQRKLGKDRWRRRRVG